jgi:hypothetical protein
MKKTDLTIEFSDSFYLNFQILELEHNQLKQYNCWIILKLKFNKSFE